MQENLKLLVKYLVDSFWAQLEKFEYLTSIQSLKVKYEQVFFLAAAAAPFFWLICLIVTFLLAVFG